MDYITRCGACGQTFIQAAHPSVVRLDTPRHHRADRPDLPCFAEGAPSTVLSSTAA